MSKSGTAHPKQSRKFHSIESFEDQQRDEIKEVFDLFDHKGNGLMSCNDLKIGLKTLGVEIKKEEIVNILSSIGKEIDSLLKFDEFYSIAMRKFSERDPNEEMQKAYRLLCDLNESDDVSEKTLTRDSLQKLAQSVNESLGIDEIEEMIRIVGSNGEITQDDFVNFMRNPVQYSNNN